MDQDELEDEIFTKTICTHLSMLLEYISTYSSDFNSMFTISHRREFFLYSMAVIIAILIWMLQSGVFAKRFEPFNFISKGVSSLDNQVWQETEKNGIASGKREKSIIVARQFRKHLRVPRYINLNCVQILAYCLQGRRPNMEDRFVLTECLPPSIDVESSQTKKSDSFKGIQDRHSIKIYGVFDGHGGEVY